MKHSSVCILAVLLSTTLSTAQEWSETTEETWKLTASDSSTNAYFGQSVAMEGDVLVVGAYFAGAAYVFDYDADRDIWSESEILSLDSSELGTRFGAVVDIDEGTLVVGAPGRDSATRDSGSIYVFDYDEVSDSWTEVEELTASDAEIRDHLGSSVALGDDLIFAGSSAESENGFYAGAVYVFRYDSDDDEWSEEQKLLASDGEAGDRFGFSVATYGDSVVIGAINYDDEEADEGAAFLFAYDDLSEEWFEEYVFTASDSGEEFRMGRSVSMGDGVVVVGAEGDDENGIGAGAVYVFRWDASLADWVEEAKLLASDGEGFDRLGRSVALVDDSLLVGAPGDDDQALAAGAAYEFRRVDDSWIEQRKLVASDGELTDALGVAVALTDEISCVGTAMEDSAAGAVYLYGGPQFLRGDVDGNGSVGALLDAIRLMSWAFLDELEPPCLDAADVDDSGEVSALLDAIYLLSWAFFLGEGPEPPAPGPDVCGLDPSVDDLDCKEVADGCS